MQHLNEVMINQYAFKFYSRSDKWLPSNLLLTVQSQSYVLGINMKFVGKWILIESLVGNQLGRHNFWQNIYLCSSCWFSELERSSFIHVSVFPSRVDLSWPLIRRIVHCEANTTRRRRLESVWLIDVHHLLKIE